MNTHLADKLVKEIQTRLKKIESGKTSMKGSSLYKRLGFSSRKNTKLLEYLLEELFKNEILVENKEVILTIKKDDQKSIQFYSKVFNEFAGKINISEGMNSGITLEPHQIEAIKKLDKYKEFEDYATILALPTGGGKTFTASYWLGKNILDKGGKVLWIAHRHSLIDQALEGFKKVSNRSVFRNQKHFRYRMISGSHNKAFRIQDDDQLVIAGIQSLQSSLETITKWINKNEVTLVIDEAHHSIAPSYVKIINLIKKQNQNKVRLLGLSATPTRINEKEEAKLWALYKDKKAYEIGLDELISRGFLAYPKFVPVNTRIDVIKELDLSERQIKSIIEKDDIAKALGSDIVKKISENVERNNFIVQHYIQNKEKYGKTLVFAIDRFNAVALNKLFKEHRIKSDFVVSSTGDFQGNDNSRVVNQEVIKKFDKGEIDVLINVQIMTEGTDIPSIQSIFLTRPTNSKILMTQMMGRGLRGEKAGGTKEAFIVSFIIETFSFTKLKWSNNKSL